MSAIVYEGGKPRIMPETQSIFTETTDGDTCEWKPDFMMQIGPTKITKNGEFTPDIEGYYGWSEVEVDVKNDLGYWVVSIDENGIPHIETEDWNLGIDDFGFPDFYFPDFDNLDLDEALSNLNDTLDGLNVDIDISLDDMNLNIDTLDTDFELNLDTLELTETELPDEIRIMHVPTKTSYKDGEEIDLDGIIVQAYRGGEVWNDESGRYIDGYIPAHELTVIADTSYHPESAGYYKKIPPEAQQIFEIHDLPTQAIVRSGGSVTGTSKTQDIIKTSMSVDGQTYGQGTLTVEKQKTIEIPQNVNWAFVKGRYRSEKEYDAIIVGKKGDQTSVAIHETIDHKFVPQNGGSTQTYHNETDSTYAITMRGYRPYGSGAYNLYGVVQTYSDNYENTEHTLSPHLEQYDIHYFTVSGGAGTYIGNDMWFVALLLDGDDIGGPMSGDEVYVSWPRPKDNKLLTASFDIRVEESEGGE